MSRKKISAVDLTEALKRSKYNRVSMETAKNLSKLNTGRGGSNGFHGYVAEHQVAKEMNKNFIDKGMNNRAYVVDNNGLADILVKNSKGKVVGKKQVKFGYENQTLKIEKYVVDNQTIVVSNDASKELVDRLRSKGAKVKRSGTSKVEAEELAKAMRRETSITKGKSSKIVPQIQQTKEVLSNCHKSGVSSAGKGAAFGGGFSLGRNAVGVMSGEKDISDAAMDVAVDTVVSGAIGYGVGAVTTAVTSTTAGAAVAGQIGAIGAAAANTAVGTTLVGGVATTATAVSTATASVLGATIAGTSAGALVIAAAPIVLAGAIIGSIGALIDW
jgi:hypothetical protein